MAAHGDDAKHIWFTEAGAPTGTGPGAVSALHQAITVRRDYEQVARWRWAGPLFIYELADSGADPNDPEQNFGLLTATELPKLAWVAFVTAMAEPLADRPSTAPAVPVAASPRPAEG